MKFEGR